MSVYTTGALWRMRLNYDVQLQQWTMAVQGPVVCNPSKLVGLVQISLLTAFRVQIP